MIKLGINGFGRIGRRVFRLAMQQEGISVVHVNDLAQTHILAHLLKYDSIHGTMPYEYHVDNESLEVNGRQTKFTHHSSVTDIDWSENQVDIVIDATGKFKTQHELTPHLQTVEKVLLSAPPTDDDIKTIVLGVNDHILDGTENIISAASCTTNNAAPMIKVLNDLCGVKQAYITTVHSYTTDQGLHDHPHKDLRRARAAGQSIVPTTTGAAKALTKVFPDLSDVIGGCGIRVPVPNSSLTDMTINVARDTDIEEVNKAFHAFAKANPDIFRYTEVPLVSIDITGSTESCIFDAQMTSVIGRMVKLIGWYDNETGYAGRLLDLVRQVSV